MQNTRIRGFVLLLAVLLCLAPTLGKADALAGEPMQRYTLYISVDTQAMSQEAARDIVDAICAKHVDGFTAVFARGGGLNDAGALAMESTLMYIILGATDAQITAILDEALVALNQQTILVETSAVALLFYSGM